ncbi:MAG: ATP-binding cassette domain-containing protein [Geminicoccaceae bacterium]|nr:MAG: ATP-binding cassette domain-containing protein [Geminicoccaceae bacterium]
MPAPARAALAVEAVGLTKTYDVGTVVDAVDLAVPTGICFGLLGPNGAGKTTTLRMTLGLTEPSAGRLTVLGHELPMEAQRLRARVGVVPQFDSLDPDFTVRENLVSYRRYFGLGADQGPRIDDLLGFANLEARADARITTLSGGMKRRLSLARALVNDPELVVLDEPTTGLDPQARQNIWQRLRQLKDQGRTLLLTTHYMEEAERLCDRLAIIDHGKLIAEGPPTSLVAEHLEPHVLELRGEQARSIDLGGIDGLRVEDVADTRLVYARSEAPLHQVMERAEGLTTILRRANLEDLFLRLTGHDLRD